MKITHKDLADLADRARAAGWEVTMRRNNHLKWTSPTGAVVFTSQTPSDHRVLHRIRQDLRRNGLRL
jgi:hypothetical protein